MFCKIWVFIILRHTSEDQNKNKIWRKNFMTNSKRIREEPKRPKEDIGMNLKKREGLSETTSPRVSARLMKLGHQIYTD